MNPFDKDPYDTSSGNNAPRSNPQRSQDLQAQVKMSMDRQLQSTTRCLSSIHETQAVGIAAAEELVDQGEKLNRAEKNVDKIIQDTKQSQRHLNSIKSVFGGLKNWWSGSDKTTAAAPVDDRGRVNRSLDAALDTSRNSNDAHPILNKKTDTLGFYEDDVKDFKDFDPDLDPTPRTRTAMTTASKTPPPAATTAQTQSSRSQLWNDYEQGLETNLGQMSSGLSNLKMLAQGMNEEIEVQNSQLDRITDKVDRSDTKVRNQNSQMKRILGK